MTNVLPYHVGPRDRYSLEFVTPDRGDFEERLAERTTERMISFKSREITIETDDGPETLYAIYSTTALDTFLEEKTEQHVEQILNERYTDDQLQVLAVILDLFSGITEAASAGTGRLEIYKDMDLLAIPEVLKYPDWGTAPVKAVGGQLLSRFVLAHPMPNANHRTAIGLLERYLRSHGDQLTVPDTGEQGSWYEWAQPYIHDSKRLLTVRRNAHLFRYAREFGVDVIRRKNEVDIDVHQYDLSVDDPFGHFGTLHERRTVEFVETVAGRTDADEDQLESITDPGWDAFVASLRRD